MEKIEINVSKKKALLSVVALTILAIGCIGLFYLAYIQVWTILFGNIGWLILMGFCVLSFIAAAFFMFMKSRDTRPALIIEKNGITDNAGLVKGAFHAWDAIEKIEAKNVFGSNLILVYLKDPEGFINAQSGMKKSMLKQTYNTQGTPVSIPGKAFEYDFNALLSLLQQKLKDNTPA